MTTQQRVAWFLQMPQGDWARPHWVADELIQKIYKSGKARMSKVELSEMLLSCAAGELGSSNSTPLTEGEVTVLLNDFFAYNECTSDCNLKIFMLQFTRMELFKTIRWLRSTRGDSFPCNELYNALQGAVGMFQGAQMAKHLCPDRYSDAPVAVDKVASFYFSYEAMLVRDAVENGVLSAFDIPRELLAAVEEGDAVQLRTVLAHPDANVNSVDSRGNSLLHVAMSRQNDDCSLLLIEHKADLNAVNADQQTCMHACIEAGDMILFQQLIYYGADVNAPSGEDRSTPLMVAVGHGNEEAVKKLLAAEADKTAKNAQGQTAAELAEDEPDILTLLQ